MISEQKKSVTAKAISLIIFFASLLWQTTGMACESVQLVRGHKATLENFDTFSRTPTRYLHTLHFNPIGDCKKLIFQIKSNTYNPQFSPSFSAYVGTSELYNSKSVLHSENNHIIESSLPSVLLPISFSLYSEKTTKPGSKNKKLSIIITSENSLGEKAIFRHTLDLNINVSSNLKAGFSGTHVDNYTHRYSLNLGKLELGKTSKNINMNILSNTRYDIELQSKNNGKLELESGTAGVAKSFIAYSLTLDGQQLDFSDDTSKLLDLSPSKKGITNSHSMYIQPTEYTKYKRAGIYSDTITISIQQKN